MQCFFVCFEVQNIEIESNFYSTAASVGFALFVVGFIIQIVAAPLFVETTADYIQVSFHFYLFVFVVF